MARVSFKTVSLRGFIPIPHQACRMAHFPAHVFHLASQRWRHKGCAGAAQAREQQDHNGCLHSGTLAGQAGSARPRSGDNFSQAGGSPNFYWTVLDSCAKTQLPVVV